MGDLFLLLGFLFGCDIRQLRVLALASSMWRRRIEKISYGLFLLRLGGGLIRPFVDGLGGGDDAIP